MSEDIESVQARLQAEAAARVQENAGAEAYAMSNQGLYKLLECLRMDLEAFGKALNIDPKSTEFQTAFKKIFYR